MEYADFHGKLKEAYYKGMGSGNSAVCESTYKCPLTGEEMADMMKSQFEGDDEQKFEFQFIDNTKKYDFLFLSYMI